MLEKIKEKWDQILLHIKEEHELTDVSFKTWLLPTEPYDVKGNTLQILVPDIHFLGYIKRKYGFLLQITIEELTGIECELEFVTLEQVGARQEEADKSQLINRALEVNRQVIQNANLNPRYTFDSFVQVKYTTRFLYMEELVLAKLILCTPSAILFSRIIRKPKFCMSQARSLPMN